MEPRHYRANYDQFLALAEFMERHGDIARPETGLQGRIKSEQLWQHLSTILNTIGGGVTKPPEKWKKVWADWKSKTKKKALAIQNGNRTGGGLNARMPLTPLEERVVAILGLTVEDRLSVPEIGLRRPNNYEAEDAIMSVELKEDELLEAPMSPLLQPPRQQLQSPAVPSLSLTPPTIQRDRSPVAAVPSQSMISSPRPRSFRRSQRVQTSFGKAVSQYAAVEQRRLHLEELREQHLHERELQRLRLEYRRIEAEIEQSRVLSRLENIARMFLERIRDCH